MIRLLQGAKGYLVVFDYGILILAIFLNVLALFGTLRGRFVLKNYRRYLVSLVVSNLLLCAINAAIFANQALMLYDITAGGVEFQICLATFQRSALLFGIFANLFTIFAMSVEHYVGIMYPLRYSSIIEKPILRNSIVLIWTGSLLLAFGDILISSIVFLIFRLNENPAKEPVTDPSCELVANLTSTTTPRTTVIPPISFISSSTWEFKQELDKLSKQSTTPLLLKSSTLSPFPSTSDAKMEPFGLQNAIVRSLITKSAESNILTCFEQKTAEQPVKLNWCRFILENKIWQEGFVTVLTLGCFFFLSFFYGRIINQMIRKNRRIFREWIITTVLLLGTFILCWLPFMLLEFVAVLIAYRINNCDSSTTFYQSTRLIQIHNIFHSIFLCFPLLDPLLHVTRVSAVKKYFKTWYCFYDKKEAAKSLVMNGSTMRLSQRNNAHSSWRFKNGEFVIVKEPTIEAKGTLHHENGETNNINNVFRVISDVTSDSLAFSSPTSQISPVNSPKHQQLNNGAIEPPLPPVEKTPNETKRTAIAALRGVALLAGSSGAHSATSAAATSEWFDDPKQIMIANDIFRMSKARATIDHKKMAPQYVTVL